MLTAHSNLYLHAHILHIIDTWAKFNFNTAAFLCFLNLDRLWTGKIFETLITITQYVGACNRLIKNGYNYLVLMSVINDKARETKYILLKKELQGSWRWRLSQTIFRIDPWQGLWLPFFRELLRTWEWDLTDPWALSLQGQTQLLSQSQEAAPGPGAAAGAVQGGLQFPDKVCLTSLVKTLMSIQP